MAKRDDRVLYLGTQGGAFKAEPNGGDDYTARPFGPQSEGGVRARVLVDQSDPRLIFVGTNRGGMFRSPDGGASWEEINKGITYKEIWSVVQRPDTGEVLVGTGPVSIFKSANHGDSWEDLEGIRTLKDSEEWTFPNPPHVAHVKGMDVRGDRIFCALEEGWLVRSLDAGKTWETIREGTHFDSHSVISMPDDDATVISTSGHGVYRSDDGGATFAGSSEGLDCQYLAQIVVHPDRPRTLFTAAAEVPPPYWTRRPEGANAGFFQSEDQGHSWHRISGGLPAQIKPAPRATAGDPDDADAYFVGMTDGSVWLSEDGGASFRQILSGVPPVQSITVGRR
jgi:photosystem II stability/assembly factor-like uncharacterized protein